MHGRFVVCMLLMVGAGFTPGSSATLIALAAPLAPPELIPSAAEDLLMGFDSGASCLSTVGCFSEFRFQLMDEGAFLYNEKAQGQGGSFTAWTANCSCVYNEFAPNNSHDLIMGYYCEGIPLCEYDTGNGGRYYPQQWFLEAYVSDSPLSNDGKIGFRATTTQCTDESC